MFLAQIFLKAFILQNMNAAKNNNLRKFKIVWITMSSFQVVLEC